jgi:N-glycosylase/DNA lyase
VLPVLTENISDFNLAATLECGQAFRWTRQPDGSYTGVVGKEVCTLRQDKGTMEGHAPSWPQLRHYVSLDRSLKQIVATFPDTPHLHAAVQKHWGLRVLRQEPWETLASFIASSTKQIIQIRHIVENLAKRFGEPITGNHYTFPTAHVIARASLPELLACKLGFRAKYLLAAARAVDTGALDLSALSRMELPRAREELLKLHGVGDKIANCTLLFSCGHDDAFPVDVWMQRALKRVKKKTDFGPYAGWAQQYLFYHERTV